jgi:hypothetical protein
MHRRHHEKSALTFARDLRNCAGETTEIESMNQQMQKCHGGCLGKQRIASSKTKQVHLNWSQLIHTLKCA